MQTMRSSLPEVTRLTTINVNAEVHHLQDLQRRHTTVTITHLFQCFVEKRMVYSTNLINLARWSPNLLKGSSNYIFP